MSMLVLRGARIATEHGVMAAAIHIVGGRIASVAGFHDVPAGARVIETHDAMVFPGLVDTHVHVNEPGREEWEGFAAATRAAAAGGVTTILDMPLNSLPPTTSAGALETKRASARGRCAVDVGFLGGLVPGGAGELEPLHRAGVFGFKCFLCPSGVDEFPALEPSELRRAAPVLAGLDALLMVHAELGTDLREPDREGDPRSYATWLNSRPVAAEAEAVRLLIDVAGETGVRVHVVHVSAPETLDLINAARTEGTRITAETCPHYLEFAAEEIPDGATVLKCAPPIRERRRREALWDALAAGAIDAVVSDHSPSPPALKQSGDFLEAWGGIASLQLRLPVMWTLARGRGIGVERLVEWLCTGPARLVGLEGCKGAIAPGCDADFVVWRPEEEFTVEASRLRHRHPVSAWEGRRLAGVVEATYLRGEPVYVRGFPEARPTGSLLAFMGARRPAAAV